MTLVAITDLEKLRPAGKILQSLGFCGLDSYMKQGVWSVISSIATTWDYILMSAQPDITAVQVLRLCLFNQSYTPRWQRFLRNTQSFLLSLEVKAHLRSFMLGFQR